jgi:hypothetical protein
MVVFMVVGISQIGKNVDIQVCISVNDDVADTIQAKLEEFAKSLDLKVLRATTTLPVEAMAYLAEEVENNREE